MIMGSTLYPSLGALTPPISFFLLVQKVRYAHFLHQQKKPLLSSAGAKREAERPLWAWESDTL
ncbi:hypothetical protein KSZ_36320 [Dictyobacter formicarum]|uniref:Uncharacterized protein n=1 Tax=Dictyobacter formicarum TaxID=2778368 RepID=A0ABQ3VIY2_9CHLR|nr:hypothetical protein KSZ_36320 [Dictyobacter formicarum]